MVSQVPAELRINSRPRGYAQDCRTSISGTIDDDVTEQELIVRPLCTTGSKSTIDCALSLTVIILHYAFCIKDLASDRQPCPR